MSSMSATAATRARRITPPPTRGRRPRGAPPWSPAWSIARMWERRSARKRFASLCSGSVRSAPPACAFADAAAAPSGLELHVLLHRDRRVELDALLHLRPGRLRRGRGRGPAPRPRARGAARPRGRPTRSRRTGGRWGRPAVADLELAGDAAEHAGDLLAGVEAGQPGAALRLFGALAGLRFERPARPPGPPGPPPAHPGGAAVAALRSWSSSRLGASRRPSRCVRRGVSLVHDSLPRRLVATGARRAHT